MKNLIEKILTKNNLTFENLKDIGYLKIKNDGYMDLHIDYLGKLSKYDHYSVAHNYEQNFDIMADPDMQFIDRNDEFLAETFQQDGLNGTIFHRGIKIDDDGELIFRGKIFEDLEKFANRWAKNLKNQGFISGKIQSKKLLFVLKLLSPFFPFF